MPFIYGLMRGTRLHSSVLRQCPVAMAQVQMQADSTQSTEVPPAERTARGQARTGKRARAMSNNLKLVPRVSLEHGRLVVVCNV